MAALLVLAGCSGGLPGQNSTSAEAGAAAESGSQESEKLGAYTTAYNKMIDTFGLTETADKYADAKISTKSPSDSIYITDGWLSQNLEALDKAIALPGSMGPLDGSAKTLRAALAKALQHVTALNVYYESKAYKDDNLARGKREDPQMKSEFAAALSALSAFDEDLTTVQRVRDDKLLASFKAKGDMLAYNGKLALRQADDLINLFKNADDVKNPAVIAKANDQVAALDKTMTDFRAAIDAAKAKNDSDQSSNVLNYGLEADNITSVVGAYRDLRESHDIDRHKSMVDAYNRAIDAANDVER